MGWTIEDVDDELQAAIELLSVGDHCTDEESRTGYHTRARRHLARARELSSVLVNRMHVIEAEYAERQANDIALVSEECAATDGSPGGNAGDIASRAPQTGWLITFTGSAVTVQDGDILVLELFAVGTGSGVYLHLYYGGSAQITAGCDLITYEKSTITFPSNITFQV